MKLEQVKLRLAKFDFLFERGDNDEYRLLCETIFKCVDVRNWKISRVELNSPFALIASRSEGAESFLSGQPDLLGGAFV